MLDGVTLRHKKAIIFYERALAIEPLAGGDSLLRARVLACPAHRSYQCSLTSDRTPSVDQSKVRVVRWVDNTYCNHLLFCPTCRRPWIIPRLCARKPPKKLRISRREREISHSQMASVSRARRSGSFDQASQIQRSSADLKLRSRYRLHYNAAMLATEGRNRD